MDRNELRRQAKEHIEVKLALEGEPPLFAHLEAVADKEGQICRMVIQT